MYANEYQGDPHLICDVLKVGNVFLEPPTDWNNLKKIIGSSKYSNSRGK